jgi:hypothetical protein
LTAKTVSTEESGPLSETTFPPALFPEREKGILAKNKILTPVVQKNEVWGGLFGKVGELV